MNRPSEYMIMTNGVTRHDYERELNKYIDYLESENKQCNSSVLMPRFSVSLVFQNNTTNKLRVLILRAVNKHAALGEAIEHYKEDARGYALILKTVIELNEA